MKKVAMIPVRLGSKRVPNKNLRMIDGRPLVWYIANAVIQSGQFKKSDIYINSESEVFKTLADSLGINFYLRPDEFATDTATNDDFALDFIQNTQCETMFQFLATSPFLSKNDVVRFCDSMLSNDYDTLISVTPVQIECIHQGQPVNFVQKEKTKPSQDLDPVLSYACGMMAWKSKKYIENMDRFGSAYHGGNGHTGFYEVSGFASVDIDTVDDFALAEVVHAYLNQEFPVEPTYWNPEDHASVVYEIDVPEILEKDGVELADYSHENMMIVNARKILKDTKENSWMRRVVNSESNSACIITQQPGQGNRLHFHPSWNEWWYILQGEWDFTIAGSVHRVVKDDIVFIPRNTWHKITAAGTGPASRLAVSRADVKHGYDLTKLKEETS